MTRRASYPSVIPHVSRPPDAVAPSCTPRRTGTAPASGDLSPSAVPTPSVRAGGRSAGLSRKARPVRLLIEPKVTPAGVRLPIEAVSEANRASHEHWRVRQVRVKTQRAVVKGMLARLGAPGSLALPVDVHLTRIAPGALDDDNLPVSMKAIRDEVAVWLGLRNDRDPRVRWVYRQRREAVRTYGVEIEFQPSGSVE